MTTIYTLPNCLQCEASKMLMEDNGKEFQEIRLDKNTEIADKFREQGYRTAPVIETPTETWWGFRPEKILALP